MIDEFERDLNILMEKLKADSDADSQLQLEALRGRLVKLHHENVVKINHSVMELVCAKHLIHRGYHVDVECLLDGLSCDLYGTKGMGSLIVEVETGYIPPEHALDPIAYSRARIASKITRYSGYGNRFCLGTPPHYILPIPPQLIAPPRSRTHEDIIMIKNLCDMYYRSPQVTLEEITNARLHTIYIIDVDNGKVLETDPEDYVERVSISFKNSNKK
ncbi:MAG: hypothetical protein QW390_00375 [Candidatus Bathyarchaeia archaeon]